MDKSKRNDIDARYGTATVKERRRSLTCRSFKLAVLYGLLIVCGLIGLALNATASNENKEGTMKHFLFKGYKVSYLEAGKGEPLVFLHNGGNDHHIWDRQIAHFSKTHRVLALDHLGYGQSEAPPIDYTLPLYSEMVAQFVDELKLAPVTIIGHCIGSAMALDYALRRPEKVKKLILFNVTSEKILNAGPLGSVYANFSRDHAARDAFIERLESQGLTKEETGRALRGQYGAADANDAEFAGHIHRLYNQKGQMRSLYNLLSNWESFRSLDQITRPKNFPPVFVIWGKANQILPAAAGEVFCHMLKPDKADFIEGGGHLVMREKPDEMNRLIEGRLAEGTRK